MIRRYRFTTPRCSTPASLVLNSSLSMALTMRSSGPTPTSSCESRTNSSGPDRSTPVGILFALKTGCPGDTLDVIGICSPEHETDLEDGVEARSAWPARMSLQMAPGGTTVGSTPNSVQTLTPNNLQSDIPALSPRPQKTDGANAGAIAKMSGMATSPVRFAPLSPSLSVLPGEGSEHDRRNRRPSVYGRWLNLHKGT